MSGYDESRPILTRGAHANLVKRHDSLTGTNITDQATFDQEERDIQAKKDDLRVLKKLLEGPLIVKPGKNLPKVEYPCFVTLTLRIGDGPKKEIQRLFYDPPFGIATVGFNGYALRSDSPVGSAIKDQPVASTQTITVNGSEQIVTITRVQALREVRTRKK